MHATTILACSGSQPAANPTHTIAPWEGRLQELFNDGIDPSAIGLAGPSVSNEAGAAWARGEAAHFIVRVRIITVNIEGFDRHRRYVLTLRVTGNPIAGPPPPSETLQVTIPQSNPSFGLAESKDLQLAGMHFIAFLREFPDNGATMLHWHLARDGQDVIDAARNGAAIASTRSD